MQDYSRGSESSLKNKLSNPKVYLAAIVLLAICAVCYTFDVDKSALLAKLLSVLLIAKLGGSKQGIAAAALAAVILAWFLPPSGSLSATGLDNRKRRELIELLPRSPSSKREQHRKSRHVPLGSSKSRRYRLLTSFVMQDNLPDGEFLASPQS